MPGATRLTCDARAGPAAASPIDTLADVVEHRRWMPKKITYLTVAPESAVAEVLGAP